MKKSALIIAAILLVGFSVLWIQHSVAADNHPKVPTALQKNFVGDTVKMIYHYPTCKKVPKVENSVAFDSPLSAIRAGFKPCKVCKPPSK